MDGGWAMAFLFLAFRYFLLNGFAGLGYDLTRGLILGQAEMFFDLTLATAKLLLMFLLLERCADFGF